MAKNGDTKVSRDEAKSVAEKLQTFRATLSPGEQRALDTTLKVFEARVTEPSVQALLDDFPEGPQLLEDVAGFRLEDPGGEQEIVWTTVTITSTLASHPVIGC